MKNYWLDRKKVREARWKRIETIVKGAIHTLKKSYKNGRD